MCLYVCLSVLASLVYRFRCLSTCLSIPVSLPVSLYDWPYICLSVFLSGFRLRPLSECLSVSLHGYFLYSMHEYMRDR